MARTVALEPTLRNVLVLGLLVNIRTLLSWGLVVEIEEAGPAERAAVGGLLHPIARVDPRCLLR